MAGNSSRRGATSKGKNKTAGSGGRVRRGLEGRGPTPKAEDRPYHKAYKSKQAAQRAGQGRPQTTKNPVGADWVVGRNPVFEALTAGLPVKQAFVAEGAERDDRLRDILKFTAEHGLPLLQVTRAELDRVTGGLVHQGVAVQLPAYEYADAEDVLADALELDGIVVALDGITDPRNLGAIVRSAAAFGAQGIIIPSRRSASMTAAAWKTSAGAAARLPIAMATNLNRALQQASKMGFTIIGLAGEGEVPVSGAPGLDGPVVIVVGSEDEGLARLVRENCDALVSIPIAGSVESLNASVAASIALYEVTQQRSGITPSE
ncbi:23S rRNA (guanosine(2251)-2'-O)-methyltransferase RlmB [Tessaracoccus sp. MC1679]|uniref:23S rRNA (guanosine(2251)-2'-O)-methyltransferase RlmB n=1 Tax=unclassified Tessaracoccus TaxID=2635419 RepID=UPI0016033DDC|nr:MULTISPECIES: 23S rRNA (guanosine(2251)-2'-O)-methyltransferase RlmB [unclassified Tessaracoccus]MBB1511774.1 23S rRNA (guanosine(2251)-2'-O)-methyltransferase RlmB [Tessaracoccus sp. MC1627]MBB1514538.1 23S rRNA (guanosine(2251)-2'-O)-methyltransferase RlmB [Tessaracoccus sp. MC1679]